jgi:hypothetical protein
MANLQIFFKIFIAILSLFVKSLSSSSNQLEKKFINRESSSNPAHLESKAIADVIREFYIATNITFNLIIYGEKSNHINDVIDGVIKQAGKSAFLITLMHIKDIKEWNHEFSQSEVIFIKSQKTLQKLYESSIGREQLTTLVPKRFKFLVYVEEINSLQQLEDSVNKTSSFIQNAPVDLRMFEFFIMSDGSRINLTARVLHSENHCGFFKLKVLNSFEKEPQQWSKKLENFNHFSNIHGCLIPFHVSISYSFYIKGITRMDENMWHRAIESGHAEFGGLTNEVVELMAQKSNFSFHFFITSKAYRTMMSNSKNHHVPFEHLIFLDTGAMSIKPGVHCSMPFNSVDFYFLVSLNDLYTNYEKMLFPFDAMTWALLLFTFGLTFGTVFGLRLCPQWLGTMILGRGEWEIKQT